MAIQHRISVQREVIKEVCETKYPSDACAIVEHEVGGVMNAESSGSIPRRKQQASDVRRKLFKKGDELAVMVERCKLNTDDKAFVRCVSLAPEPVVILCTDFQINELKRCCIRSNNASVVSVDPTFELGNFYVTPICFLHPMFISRDTGRNPLFIGPILIHKRMTFQAYHFFASQLVNLCPDIAPLKCFGTDGEKALFQAFMSVFPQAIHLRCFNHFKANVAEGASL